MKRIYLSIFMSLLWLSGLTSAASAAEVTDGDFETYGLFLYDGLPYHLLDDGTVEICNTDHVKGVYVYGNSITTPTVVIPEKVSYAGQEYRVTRVGNQTFQGCTSVTSVTIPVGVTSIGYQAFYNANNVTLATGFPSTLKVIEGNCFYMCRNLGSIVLPEGLTTLGTGCFTRTFDYGGKIEEFVFPGTLTTYINEQGETVDFATICSDRKAGDVGKIVINANEDWDELPFSFSTFSRGLNCKEVVINRDLVSPNQYYNVNLDNVNGLETIRFGAQVTKLPDMSGCTSLTTIYCDAPTPPSGLSLPVNAANNITFVIPEKYLAAYTKDAAWAAYLPVAVEPSPVNAYVDFEKIGYTVGEGDNLGAVMISWNDGPRKGVDNLVYGVRFNSGATPSSIIESVVAADSRLQRIGNGGYAYDNTDKGTIVEKYDHYAEPGDQYVWNIYADEKPGAGSVVYLCYEPKSKDTTKVPEAPAYTFYIPAGEEPCARFPEGYNMPIADEMILPVWTRTGGVGGVYTLFAWDAYPFQVNTQGLNQTEQAEGRPYAAVDFLYVAFNDKGGQSGISRYVPSPRTVSATVQARTKQGTGSEEVIDSEWSPRATFNIVAPEIPIAKINDKNISVGGSMAATPLKDLVDYEPKDATYTRFFIEILDSDYNPVSIYRQDVYPAPYDETIELKGYEYWLGNLSVSSGASDAIFNLKYFYGLEETGDNEYSQSDDLQGMLAFSVNANPVKAVALEGDFDAGIEMTVHDIVALRTKAMPAKANQSVIMSIENATDENIATAYSVSGYMPDGETLGRFTELVSYKTGEFDLVLTSAENAAVSRTYHVKVNAAEPVSESDFTAGTFWLNEDWFTHKNGTLNYLKSPVVKSDEDIIYRPYSTVNDNAGFGATSQYAMVFGDKLFVMSKQASDMGDLRGQVGGRLVVADANTLKKIAVFPEIGGDGRACVGVRAGKAYIGHHAGVRVLTWDADDNMTLADGNIEGINNNVQGDDSTIEGNQALYNQQIGDMVASANHAFVMQQSRGIHIIDTDTDKVVKLIEDANVGAITQTSDGNVWYATQTGASAGHSVLHCIDPKTLEETREPVEVPGVIQTGWGAWRSCNFFGAVTEQKLFWSGSASSIQGSSDPEIYAWDVESDPTGLEPIFSFGSVPGVNNDVKQIIYATMRYDDRVGKILFATTTAPSANYRYNWLNFLDTNDGSLSSVRLKDYYWFPAMPVFPDVEGPVMEEVDDLTLDLRNGEVPVDITLNATDADHIDANIRFSLVDTPTAMAEDNFTDPVVHTKLSGNVLTVTPKNPGSHVIGVNVESNGRTATHAVNVKVVGTATSVDELKCSRSVRTEDGKVIISGYNGIAFRLIDMTGRQVEQFTCSSDNYEHTLAVTPGVYVIAGENGFAKKLVVK